MNTTTTNTALNAADALAKKISGKTQVSRFGFIWRFAAIVLVFAAVFAAVILGGQYAITYVAAAGLSETAATAITYSIMGAGGLISGALAWFTTTTLEKLIERRSATKLAAGAKRAAAAVVDIVDGAAAAA
jgi:hypothetical protein